MKIPLPLVKYMNANTKKHKNNIACSQRYVPRDGSNTKMKPAMHVGMKIIKSIYCPLIGVDLL